MKNYILYLAIISLFLCSCSKDEVLDESVLEELPSFEYAGYTYYVHPRLAIYQWSSSYKYIAKEDIESIVNSLDSYGFHSWFIPSMNEMEQVAVAIDLPTIFDGADLVYLTITGSSYSLLGKYGDIWADIWDHNHNSSVYMFYYTVRPLIKFKK